MNIMRGERAGRGKKMTEHVRGSKVKICGWKESSEEEEYSQRN